MRHALPHHSHRNPIARALGFVAATALGAGLSLVPLSSSAQDAVSRPAVVVELFTSQGCSSCPPADALFSKVAKRDDVIALALHVDYWDYIGWKDVFADPKFTLRQRAYARAAGHRTIYTPQMIVSGVDHIVGFKPMELADLIMDHRSKAGPTSVALSATRIEDALTISMVPLGPLPPAMRVQVVQFRPLEKVTIRMGENAGKTIDYANVVTSWNYVADWDGVAPLQVDVPTITADPVAVILQQDVNQLPGHIVAAVRID
ncbi:DUF1223 domain-containing protein [Pacificibacter marinus]|uniref:DUF1223 domain-containing protein n=1 Tax=Pacificibacter marinus TaxID=658057 RepID=A0A1Y5RLL1_9RHOB|nr:DUF1223 domain-containing protein [Pacificibacter marinus]SEK17539.1 hypothetical protein SAMN04488032_10130 [Pacificibacter marinus]SLN20339.1 hypothetical protein PAM7971_00620 [Pacificibacter marinus]